MKLLLILSLILSLLPSQRIPGPGGSKPSSTSFAIVSDISGFNGTAATSVTTGNFGTNPSSGQLIVVGQGLETSGVSGPVCNTTPPTDTLGTTFTFLVQSNVQPNAFGSPACMYYGVTTSGGADAVTCKWSASVSSQDCHAILVQGQAASGIADQSCVGISSAGANNPACGTSITPVQNGELILVYVDYGNGTLAPGTGFAFVSGRDNSEFLFQATAAAITPSYGNTSAPSYTLVAGSFKHL